MPRPEYTSNAGNEAANENTRILRSAHLRKKPAASASGTTSSPENGSGTADTVESVICGRVVSVNKRTTRRPRMPAYQAGCCLMSPSTLSRITSS